MKEAHTNVFRNTDRLPPKHSNSPPFHSVSFAGITLLVSPHLCTAGLCLLANTKTNRTKMSSNPRVHTMICRENYGSSLNSPARGRVSDRTSEVRTVEYAYSKVEGGDLGEDFSRQVLPFGLKFLKVAFIHC